jgi:dinuclear metal center YbgI/SA1388 family protein
MSTQSARDLVAFLDTYLNIRHYVDRSNNGLQVQGAPHISRVAFAVDAAQASFKVASEAGAQLLIVHHGLFWSEHLQITGAHYTRVRQLIEHGLALYACHIPLDAHPEVGNNIELARMAGLTRIEPWGTHKKDSIGFIGDLPEAIPVRALNARLETQIGVSNRVQGDGMASRVAVCSGFGITLLDEAVAAGADTLITGETSHQWFHPVAEQAINVIYGGHYQTETVGLKALQRVVAARFDIDTVFIDLPTGL